MPVLTYLHNIEKTGYRHFGDILYLGEFLFGTFKTVTKIEKNFKCHFCGTSHKSVSALWERYVRRAFL